MNLSNMKDYIGIPLSLEKLLILFETWMWIFLLLIIFLLFDTEVNLWGLNENFSLLVSNEELGLRL